MTRTILVVDDSPTIVKFVAFSLKSSGFSVVTATDGMDAVEKLSGTNRPVTMIITDLNMPNLDGYGLIETVRQNPQHAMTPIIILSSEDRPEDKERGMKAGASAYLVKPFKSEKLLEEVDRLLQATGGRGCLI